MEECSFCGRRAVYFEERSGVHRCDRCFKENIEKRFRETVNEWDMLDPGDKVVVGVSGGTDSLSALRLLHDYSQYKDIDIVSLTIDEGIEGYRDESMETVEEHAEDLGLRQVTIKFEDVFGKSLDELSEISEEENGPDPCTLCGILRRELLNQASKELEADKLAIGHNLDDVVQTIMLNYVRGDLNRLKRLRPRTEGKEGFVPRIKPLRRIKEKEIGIYAMLNGFDPHIDECPHVGGMRSEVREFLNMMETNHPTTKHKILRMNDKLRGQLPENSQDFELQECVICGEPTPEGTCRSCDLLQQLGIKRNEQTLIS